MIAHIGRVGPEDFIWAFATGATAWILAALPSREQLRPNISLPRSVTRYAIVTSIGAIIFVPLWLGGAGVMNAFLASNIALAIVLILLQPALWRLAAFGAIGLGVLNLVVMVINLALCPTYYAQFSPAALSGNTFLGIPLEELAWAITTGAVWPLVTCYVLDIQPARSDL